MRFRLPFVSRKAHDRKVAWLLMQVADYLGKLALASSERRQLEGELSRLRVHFEDTVKAKDKAYAVVAKQYYDADDARIRVAARMIRLANRLDSFGIPHPYDWAAPLPYWLTSYVTADIHGVRGEIGGMGGDPGGDDPRFNTALAMGLKSCQTSPPSPTE